MSAAILLNRPGARNGNPMRPLVVYTGQGLALADGFNLVQTLRSDDALESECFARVTKTERNDLDAVLLACGEAGKPSFDILMKAIRRACYDVRKAGLQLAQHKALFKLLQDESRRRPVLHLTANIDGLTTSLAVNTFGAVWRPRRELADIEAIVKDAQDVIGRGLGFLHVPVHGEVGLLAHQSREGARRIETIDEDDGRPRWSTVHEGLGRVRVKDVPNAMAFSGFGYRLLTNLTCGAATPYVDENVSATFPVLEPADLIIVGYGAGNVAGRDDYPLESRVRDATAQPRALGANWRAVCYQPHKTTAGRTIDWYEQRGFEIVPHGDGDLGEAVRTALGRQR